MSEGTKHSAFEREFQAWSQGFMTKPQRTFCLGLMVVVLTGLVFIAPRMANDAYSYFFPAPLENPFKTTQIIYSNIIPNSTDVIDLDHAGSLTPAPGNVIEMVMSDGVCIPKETPLDYSQGIVLILNAAASFAAHDLTDPSKPSRSVSWVSPPPPSSYITFKPQVTKEIVTNKRRFSVTLARILNLTTVENGVYYGYVFDIVEQ